MRLLAVSDLHLGHRANHEAWLELPRRPADWLIIGGDVGETLAHLELALEVAQERFGRVLWVPGNHELWTTDGLAGDAKYAAAVELCRSRGVSTPEDEWPIWEGAGGPVRVVLLFLLYDYSFRPAHVAAEDAVGWAKESGIVCADEARVDPGGGRDFPAWCRERVRASAARLDALDDGLPTVLVNHFPLRRDQVRLGLIPRFSIWSGTTLTEDWHRRYRARVVVSGHLHVPFTDTVDGVRFEEVSLGYPKQWRRRDAGIAEHLREILPGPGVVSRGAVFAAERRMAPRRSR